MDTITLTQQMLTDIISTAVAQGIRSYEAGRNGEVSYRKGVQIYGQWFVNAVARDDLKGRRRGSGSNSKITYQVSDIEALRAKEIAETSRIINTK